MILAQHISDHGGRFLVWAVREQTSFGHGIENTSLYRFEAIARIRQGAADNDTHRVVEITSLYFVFDIDVRYSLLHGSIIAIKSSQSIWWIGGNALFIVGKTRFRA